MANRTRLTWPDAYYVQYAYDAQNRMLTASENGSTLLATYDYDDLGRRKSVQYGAAKAKVNYTFNGENDLLIAHRAHRVEVERGQAGGRPA